MEISKSSSKPWSISNISFNNHLHFPSELKMENLALDLNENRSQISLLNLGDPKIQISQHLNKGENPEQNLSPYFPRSRIHDGDQFFNLNSGCSLFNEGIFGLESGSSFNNNFAPQNLNFKINNFSSNNKCNEDKKISI